MCNITYELHFSKYLDSMWWDDYHQMKNGEEYSSFLTVWSDFADKAELDFDFDFEGVTIKVELSKTQARELEEMLGKYPNCLKVLSYY